MRDPCEDIYNDNNGKSSLPFEYKIIRTKHMLKLCVIMSQTSRVILTANTCTTP